MNLDKIIGYNKETGKPITIGDLTSKLDAELKPIMEERDRVFAAKIAKIVVDAGSENIEEKLN